MPTGREIALLFAVAAAGLFLIRRAAARLGDPRLLRLQAVFLLKVTLVLIVLRVGWMPMLGTGSSVSGYDPQRFYFDAVALLDGGFDPEVARAAHLNYTGIVWYYGLVMAAFGRSPFAPALVNAFVTLVAVLVLVEAGYRIRTERGRNDWILGLGMLLPEIVWFDALTARETLTMSLLTIATLGAGTAFMGAPGPWKRIALAASSLFLLGLVRPEMLVPAVAAIGILAVAVRPGLRRGRVAAGLAAVTVAALLLTPAVRSFLGSNSMPLLKIIDQALVGKREGIETIAWGHRSIGRLFVSHSVAGVFVSTFPRLVLYLVAPLGAVPLNVAGLAAGHWVDWQAVLQGASALMNVALVPLALAGFAVALADRARRNDLVFHVPCWCVLFAIAAGNQIIHERYRVMGMLLLWGCVRLGRTAPRRFLVAAYAVWFGTLALGGILILAYKLAA